MDLSAKKKGRLPLRPRWRVPTFLIKFAVPITKSFRDAVGFGGEEEYLERISLPASRCDGSTAFQILAGKVRTVVARGFEKHQFPGSCRQLLATFAFPISCLCASFWSRLQERARGRERERERTRKIYWIGEWRSGQIEPRKGYNTRKHNYTMQIALKCKNYLYTEKLRILFNERKKNAQTREDKKEETESLSLRDWEFVDVKEIYVILWKRLHKLRIFWRWTKGRTCEGRTAGNFCGRSRCFAVTPLRNICRGWPTHMMDIAFCANPAWICR